MKEGVAVDPKSRSGRRRVPIAAVFRDILLEHKIHPSNELVLSRPDGSPVNPTTSSARATKAWRRVGLNPITIHEARHTFASLMIAAGVNARALSPYMGHAAVTITYDRYGHLMPGNEEEAAALLDAYLERSDTLGRLAALDG